MAGAVVARDLLRAETSKMDDLLSMFEGLNCADRSDLTANFCRILQCDKKVAEFFLDSVRLTSHVAARTCPLAGTHALMFFCRICLNLLVVHLASRPLGQVICRLSKASLCRSHHVATIDSTHMGVTRSSLNSILSGCLPNRESRRPNGTSPERSTRS